MLAIEAGTGTGKTFAYLVPALLSGRQVIISTGTRTLQDQLFNRDLPTVAQALGRPARVALLKGRANYLCLHRLELAESAPQLPGIPQPNERMLGRIRRWSRTTRPATSPRSRACATRIPLRAAVTSTRENCLGATCPAYSTLPRRRGAARGAGGRHRRRQSSPAARRPRAQGRGLRRAAAGRRGRDPRRGAPDAGDRRAVFRRASSRSAPGGAASRAMRSRSSRGSASRSRRRRERLAALESAIVEATRRARRRERAHGLARAAAMPSWTRSTRIREALTSRSAQELSDARCGRPGPAPCRAPRREACRIADGDRAMRTRTRACARSRRGRGSFTLAFTPFEVATRFGELMRAQGGAWIFTSATLAVGDDFSHFTRAHRLRPRRTPCASRARSTSRARRCSTCRKALPDPASREYTSRVVARRAAARRGARAGAAFCCSPAIARCSEAARDAASALGFRERFPLLVQGEAPRESAAAALSRARQRRAARHRELLGRRRRAGRRARARRDRQAAVRGARRSAAQGAARRHPPRAAAIRSTNTSCRRRCSRSSRASAG